MTDNAKIIVQLRTLVQLTQTEAQIAEVRVAQARTEAVRRELTQNARHAGERTKALTDTLRDLGGVPDVLTPTFGRLAALVKSAVDQTEPLDEALLQDLALENQLVDRARYLKSLATTAELPKVVKLADRLITAHTATVEWLTTVLAEEALGGPSALQATPLQRVAGGASRVINLPARYATRTVNRTVDSVQQNTEQTRSRLSSVTDKAGTFTDAVRETLTSGRNASLQRAEKIARREGDRDTAAAVHETRRDLGALTLEELPIKQYDTLNISESVKAIKDLGQVEDVRAIMAYEETHANRSSVVSAAQTQVATLAKQVVGIS